MGLKENWLQKMAIDRLSNKAILSIGASDGGSKLDRDAVRELLSIAGYTHRRERDLDIYLPRPEAASQDILVLDNALGFYRTDIADIALRKSPTVKEMVSIRNAIKILNDKDVLISRKADSIGRLQQEAIGTLDLQITEAGLDEMLADARESLHNKYGEGVEEVLVILADMLGFQVDPRPFGLDHHRVIGRVSSTRAGDAALFPAAVFGRIHNRLIWLLKPISAADPETVKRYKTLTASPDLSMVLVDEDALQALKDQAMRKS
ncbi:hypothetical protein [Desulfatirhabdium butyrativorans]|uniref:hypothetical protein n=1 Tax=Desulfatirhabdium butyrativorans TaxID=340467 RepID=UPI000416FF79|nr:hypothetical protein [Desulfatirhabdium butyrativorans]